MSRELLIAAGPGEWRAALVENGVAVELFVERGEGAEAGSIYLGRVIRKLPALAASLVDIGGERPAFLPDRDILPRGARLEEGERAVLQIRREAQGGKSARGSARLVLRGPRIDLGVGEAGLQGAEALPPEDRDTLRATLAGGAAEPGAGLRLRCAAPIATLSAEAALLFRRWGEIRTRAAQLDPPARLDPPPTFAAALAGAMLLAPERVVVDDPASLPEIRTAFLGVEVLHQTEALRPIDLDAAFERALSPTVALDGGGAVHFEIARAAVLIDVDTGSPLTASPARVPLAANLGAARLIARALRLRNLGGGIIVDFVGLDGAGEREPIRAVLTDALSADPARPQILGWTRLGHLELVRPRHRRPLVEALLERSPEDAFVKSAATIAYEALRAVRRADRANPGRGWRLVAAPEVADVLAGPAGAARQALEARLGRGVVVSIEPQRRRDRFEIIAQ